MDSMRPLSNSLPPTRRRLDHPELLADFKAAALSVTNLYKTANASQDKARAAGYQDALEDLLGFLDREELGFMDGEGWRVRRWVAERLVDDGSQRRAVTSEDEAEEAGGQVENNTRSSSPDIQRKLHTPAMPMSSSEVQETSPRRTAVSEPPPPPTYSQPPTQPPSREDFTFQPSYEHPTNHDREASSTMDLDNSSAPTTPNTETSTQVRLIHRSGRGRHTNHNRRVVTTGSTPTINFNLGSGAGSKRKMPYPDFFDITGLNFEGQERKDGGGGGRGGKRGRHV